MRGGGVRLAVEFLTGAGVEYSREESKAEPWVVLVELRIVSPPSVLRRCFPIRERVNTGGAAEGSDVLHSAEEGTGSLLSFAMFGFSVLQCVSFSDAASKCSAVNL